MRSNKDVLTDFANASIELIQKNMDSLNVNASGNARKTLSQKVEIQPDYSMMQIKGEKYLGAVEYGRKGLGKDAWASSGFVDIIREWLVQKGLSLNAYAVANKIQKYGTKQFRLKTPRGILDGVISQPRLGELMKDLATTNAMIIKGELIKEFKDGFAVNKTIMQ